MPTTVAFYDTHGNAHLLDVDCIESVSISVRWRKEDDVWSLRTKSGLVYSLEEDQALIVESKWTGLDESDILATFGRQV